MVGGAEFVVLGFFEEAPFLAFEGLGALAVVAALVGVAEGGHGCDLGVGEVVWKEGSRREVFGWEGILPCQETCGGCVRSNAEVRVGRALHFRL